MPSIVQTLTRKIYDLENIGRRPNTLIPGGREGNDEREEKLRHYVGNLFRDKLDIPDSTTKRIHRLGRRHISRDRPIIMKLRDFREKICSQKQS